MIQKFSFLGSEYSFEEAKFVIIPVLYGECGSRESPIQIIRESLNLPSYDQFTGISYRDIPVYTYDLVIPGSHPETAIREIRNVLEHVTTHGKIPVMIGGDHSITIATSGLFRRYVMIDAHLDLYEEYQGNPYNHACVARRLIEGGAEVYHYGTRIIEDEERHIESKIIDRIQLNDIYLSIDVDVLDPVYIDSNVPVPGGISYSRLVNAIHEIQGNILGADVVEIINNRKSCYLGAHLVATLLASLTKH
ncbi:MAG: arginase family protein [Candidatus Micrarchaeota archaeon]|nr:arginase family protein [Candidatus Micrarchaeota archaeon]MCX8154272.1 arginase family protein [Candidatus Micrarchaeota archaeon]